MLFPWKNSLVRHKSSEKNHQLKLLRSPGQITMKIFRHWHLQQLRQQPNIVLQSDKKIPRTRPVLMIHQNYFTVSQMIPLPWILPIRSNMILAIFPSYSSNNLLTQGLLTKDLLDQEMLD